MGSNFLQLTANLKFLSTLLVPTQPGLVADFVFSWEKAKTMTTKLLLFDLDDTLYDHTHAARCGLRYVQGRFAKLQPFSLTELENTFFELLEAMHVRILRGEVEAETGRILRFQQFLNHYGHPLTFDEAATIARSYKVRYLQSQQAVPGARELLAALKPGFTIGIVSNNFTVQQWQKLKIIRLDSLVDFMVTSEDVSVPKPDPAMFYRALEIARATPEQTLVIGDSWRSDVVGANRARLRVIWFNREKAICPDESWVVGNVDDFRPVASTVKLVHSILS